MDGTVKQEEVEVNSPDSVATSCGHIDKVCQKMESIQLSGQAAHDNIEKISEETKINDYKEKLEHLQTVVSDKQSVIEELTRKYNESTIKLQQLVKANPQIVKDNKTNLSTGHHPGGDVCMSPSVPDSHRDEIQNKNYEIAQLKEYMKQYYDMVMKANGEKEKLSRELHHSTSLNSKLKLQANDLVQEKELLYDKLSQSQAKVEAVMKENEELKLKLSASSSPSISPQGVVHIEESNAQLRGLKAENEKLTMEKDGLNRHIKEQEEKIEKLTIRCGRVEEDLQKASANSGRRNHQPTDENHDWHFKSLDAKDEKITELTFLFTQSQEKIDELNKKLQSQSCNMTDVNDNFFIKEQLKAFQDDYHAERQEKQKILQEQRQLEEKNDALMKQLYGSRYNTDRPQYSSQMPSAHSHPPHSRQYTPTHPRHNDVSRDELANLDPYRPVTHLPGPHGNTIPPRPYPTHERCNYYPGPPGPYPPNFHHDDNNPENRGHPRDPH